jgi:hypothetical protein
MKKKSRERAYSYVLERDASIARRNQMELKGRLECGICCDISDSVF